LGRLGGHESPSFLAWNRNKRSLAPNLKSPAVRDLVVRMAERADVVVQSFRPGAMSNTGWANQPPVPLGAGLPDQLGAMNMVDDILSALSHREKTGEGQEVRGNLMARMNAHLGQKCAVVLHLDRDFERPNSGVGHPGMDAPFGVYETADSHVTIAFSPFAKLIEAIDRPDLAEHEDPARDVLNLLRSEVDPLGLRRLEFLAARDRASLFDEIIGADRTFVENALRSYRS
jgi:crotonobetainyl-CoA:carnitine CoA-transferase CaiB-like acyl-CoA transferase